MSGPITYSAEFSPEIKAMLKMRAEERRMITSYENLLSEFKNQSTLSSKNIQIENKKEIEQRRINASVKEYVSRNSIADFSAYKGERIPTDTEISFKKQQEYDNVLENYARICSVLNVDMADCFKYDESRYDELIEQVKAETQRLEKLQIQQLQNQLIYETSLKVLAEMGYELIGENTITKKSGISIKSTLLRIDEDTAVNLTMTPNGQYTFELVGINNDGHAPTESEITKLFSLMCSKCHGDFVMIRKKMAEHGVMINDVNERNPDISYCRSKNISDYSQSKEDESEMNCEEKRQLNGKI